MRKTWMLAFAPLRKNKGQTASLLVLLTVAGTLLYIGLLLALNTGKFFDRKAEELNAADIVLTIQDTIFSEADIAWFRDNPKVESVEILETVVFPNANIQYAGNLMNLSIVAFDNKKLGGLFSPRFIGETRSDIGPDAVYMPYIFKAGGGFALGDIIEINYGTDMYSLKIAGFFEDVHFGYIGLGVIGMILPDYDGFIGTLNSPAHCSTLLTRVYNKDDSDIFNEYAFDKFLNTDPEFFGTGFLSGSSYPNAKLGSTILGDIISVIVILFSLLIVVIALIVAHFRITNSIEEDMANIGSLKAAGFRSGQIISGILAQFISVALIGCGLGILASTAVLPMLFSAFASQNGLVWDMGFDMTSAILTIAVISVSVLLTTLWAARRIKKLHPIIALRGGISTHSFKKNRFPLDTSKSGLGFLLALKAMKLKQNVSIALICATVTFASAVFAILYYNVGVNDRAFVNLVVSEYCDAEVVISKDKDIDPWQMLEDIRKMDGVENAVFYSYLTGQTGRRFIQFHITENFAELTGLYIYEGRSPKHDNETAIGGVMAAELGKKIGDTFHVSFQGGTAEYLIVGLGQSGSNNGWTAELTIDGARLMNPDYRPRLINVYAEKGVTPYDLCETLRTGLGDHAESIANVEESSAALLNTYVNLIFIITVLILCVTSLVIALVLYLIIKTSILRRRRALGIQKAVGFTTGQLMRQIAMSFMPPVIAGAALGGVLGGVYANPLYSVLFRSIGFMRTEFIVLPILVAVTGAAIGAFAYLVATLVSWRIRKISAYTLASE